MLLFRCLARLVRRRANAVVLDALERGDHLLCDLGVTLSDVLLLADVGVEVVGFAQSFARGGELPGAAPQSDVSRLFDHERQPCLILAEQRVENVAAVARGPMNGTRVTPSSMCDLPPHMSPIPLMIEVLCPVELGA